MTLEGQALADRLGGATPFFSDTPPPGAVLESAQGKLPPPEQTAQPSAAPAFDMGSPTLGSGPS